MFFQKNSFYKKGIQHLGMFVLLCFFAKNSFAQAPGMLEFAGRTIKDNKPLAGATVTVLRNGTIQQEQIKTGKNGKFKFFLVFGSDYKITFSYPGCVDMHLMVYTGKLAKEKSDIFPLYETDVPFFETTATDVRISKYKNPFTKVVYDGKKAFKDDEAYLADFMKDLLIDAAEQAKIFMEKAEKEKAEKEKQEAAEKAKRDAEEKARKEAEDKLLAEQKAKEELIKAAELARLKEEAEKQRLKDAEKESMESEAIRLQREKEAKDLMAKKNKEIKTNYENDLLKMVAENERNIKQQAYNIKKQEGRTSTVIEQMRRENDLKAKADKLKEEQLAKQKLTLENKQYKNQQMRKLVEAAAFAERSVKISSQKTIPDTKNYSRKIQPNVAVTVDDGFVKTTRTTVVTLNKQITTYKKESYFWGGVTCYKNDIEIDELVYNIEVAYYLSYINYTNETQTTKSLQNDTK